MKTIVITGPEACGKSNLTSSLSTELNGHKVMEYARWYLPRLHRLYEFEDLLAISRGQERGVLKKLNAQYRRKFLFIDTWAVVLMIWSEYKYGRTHPAFQSLLKRYKIDLYLLCAPDIPWTNDPLRENPNDRDELFQLYQEKLSRLKVPYAVVRGQNAERVQNALEIIEALS